MPRKPRKLRAEMNRIPSNVTQEFIDDLNCRQFLNEGGGRSIYDNELNEEEQKMANEFSRCGWKLEKWLKYRERKIEKAKARKLKSKKV
jgi:hypothetical protein